MNIADIRAERHKAHTRLTELSEKDVLTSEEDAEFTTLVTTIKSYDTQVNRHKTTAELALKDATPVAALPGTVTASVETDPYMKDKSLVVGGMMHAIARHGHPSIARQLVAQEYGENHPVTKALVVSTGTAGGLIVPPDYMAEIIELLRAQAVVRRSGPRNMPMPRGTLTIPSQTAAATAAYGTEVGQIKTSQPSVGNIVASYKKLTALVPLSNDLMRYASPAADALVRDDMVKVIGLAEDLAFLQGDGTAGKPRGYLSFANGYNVSLGGVAGNWLNSGNSTAPTKGNFLLSNSTFTLTTVTNELSGAINKLDTANVPDSKRVWYMHPRTYNYLFSVQNSLGVYVFRDELTRGTLFSYPFFKTTQISTDIWDTSGSNKDLSFLFLVELTDALLLDSMQLEMAVFTAGSYTDSAGASQNLIQNDQTVIRAIAEHDFQMRHDASIAVVWGVRWAPALT